MLIMMRGWTSVLRWCAFWMKYLSIFSVTLKSAIIPSFMGLTTLRLPGVRPNISLASFLADCLDFAGAVVESNGRGLVDHDTLVPGIDAHVNCTKSIAKSAENKVNNRRRLLREIRVKQSIDDGLRLIRRPQKTAESGLLAKV